MQKHTFFYSVILIALLAFSGCNKDTTKLDNILNTSVTVVAAEQASNLVAIDNTHLYYQSGSDIAGNAQVGSILVGGVSNIAPFGYARKVTKKTMNGSQVQLETVDASLDEIYDQADIDFTTNMEPKDTLARRSTSNPTFFYFPLAVNFSSSHGQLNLTGELNFNTQYTFK